MNEPASESFAEVAVFCALEKTLHYSVSSELQARVQIGVRVLVPLGRREISGLVVALALQPPLMPSEIKLRPIRAVLDSAPVLPHDLLELSLWISDYYCYPLGEVIQTVLPLSKSDVSQPHPVKVKHVRVIKSPDPVRIHKNPNALRLFELLDEAGGTVPLRSLRSHISNVDYWIRKLQGEGEICIDEIEEIRESFYGQAIEPADPPALTPLQQEVYDEVSAILDKPSFQPFLLFGVTGSGKTEVYLRLADRALERGKGVLVLVPEIALSSQMESLFRQRFGSRLAVWHSGLSQGTRSDQWRELLTGNKRVVLGVRSAVFMPVHDLGLIIVDEEHDSSFKQDDHLRYHARDVALVRARMLGIPILLGSATPSLQSFHQYRIGRYRLLSLPHRIQDRPQPEIQVVDMKRESRRSKILSSALQQALAQTVQENEQALIFLNRRGFAAFVLCNVCGQVVQCKHCSVSLTYHQRDDLLRCHYCGWERTVPERCPECDHASLFTHGVGTERVEEEIRKIDGSIRVVRVDRDTIQHARQLVECLNAVRQNKANVLIGTQMVAKGHDFPNITLVGVVNADTSLQIPDYRSGEATVQILMQVAGRAGRGDKPGRVILQTYNPSHYTIEAVVRMDYRGFCEKELESRRQLQYPPFSRFLRLLVTSPEAEETRNAAAELASVCRDTAAQLRLSDQHVAIFGPSPAPLSKLSNRYRWHVFAKSWTNKDMQQFTTRVLERCKTLQALRRVQIAVDRDPLTSM